MSLLWLRLAHRMESVDKLLTYQPTDGPDWDAVHDNYDWDHPQMRSFVDDVRRNGVRTPVMVDYENDPPTVEDGHTRVLAARKAGVSHVPVRQGSNWDRIMEEG